MIGDENLIVQGKCENNWRVICSAPVKVIFSEDLQIQRREYRSVMQPEMFWMKKVSLLVMRSLLMIRENRIQIG